MSSTQQDHREAGAEEWATGFIGPFRQKCDDTAENDYEGFAFDDAREGVRA